jgi:hypothetical protein
MDFTRLRLLPPPRLRVLLELLELLELRNLLLPLFSAKAVLQTAPANKAATIAT